MMLILNTANFTMANVQSWYRFLIVYEQLTWVWTRTWLFYVEQKCRLIRGKLVGGTSAFDCMSYIRGSHSDYDSWSSATGCRGWSYDDVLPYFIKSESNTNKEFIKSGLIDENLYTV